jgi:hypothetical protein
VGGADGTVRLAETATGKELARLAGHQGAVTCVSFSQDGRYLASGGADTTVLVWDVAGLNRAAPAVALSPGELDGLWGNLTSADSPQAYQAITRLAAAPGQAVPFLRERLRPVPAGVRERIAGLVAGLDSSRYRVREKSSAELEYLGQLAEPFLRQTLEGKPPPEVRRRVERLLARRETPERQVPSPEVLRELRAVEVLERIGTGEALEMLRGLARGVSEAPLTREAGAAAERLARRGGAPAGRE